MARFSFGGKVSPGEFFRLIRFFRTAYSHNRVLRRSRTGPRRPPDLPRGLETLSVRQNARAPPSVRHAKLDRACRRVRSQSTMPARSLPRGRNLGNLPKSPVPAGWSIDPGTRQKAIERNCEQVLLPVFLSIRKCFSKAQRWCRRVQLTAEIFRAQNRTSNRGT